MKVQNIEKVIKDFCAAARTEASTTAEMDTRIINDATAAHEKSKKEQSAEPGPNIWRIIMKNPMTKLATAAAIIIAVLIGVNQFGGSIDGSSKAYAMTDVPELFYSARNIYMKAIMYFPEAGKDAASATVEIENWLDIENGRWRSIKPSTCSDPEGFKFSLTEEILDGSDFELNIDHGEKEASFTKRTELYKKLHCRQYTETMMTFLCGDPQFYDLYENIGTEVIDGHTYNIWELIIEQERVSDFKMQAWLSPETGDVAKGIIWFRSEVEDDWVKKLEITTIEQNTFMPDELFVIEAPADYELTNTRQTAHEGKFARLVGGWNSFVLEKYLMFALPDGSVIMCWASRDNDSKQSQASLFADLQFGGDFPKLPNEVYALETNLKGQKSVLQGRHLCYTEQDGKFYEWGLYVPKEKMSQLEARILACTLVFRNHGEAKNSATLGSTVDLLIRDVVDFDTFILGAMAEFSDDGSPPDGITYETVLQLVDDIRLGLG